MNIRNKKDVLKLYSIEGIDYDKVIAKYRELCEQGIRDIDDDCVVMSGDKIEVTSHITRKPRKPLNDYNRTLRKAIYLVHTIAYRQVTNRNKDVVGARLLKSLLKRVIGDDVYELLSALQILGYIEIVDGYIVGKKSMLYKVNGNITTTECSDFTIIGYIEKIKEILHNEVLQRMSTPEFKAIYGDEFTDTYIKNLNKFHIKDKEGFYSYIIEQIVLSPIKEAYYKYIIDLFNSKFKIHSIDSNNRIYHILTSLERELKQYLNIQFSIDCKNSHPVLFNYFIYISKGLSIDISYKLSFIFYNISKDTIYISNNHYDVEKLRNELKNNDIDISIIAGFSDDELLYIWKSTIGIFWDDICEYHKDEGLDRGTIKELMFQEVFYSKTSRVTKKRFAKEFKSAYPNVYALIAKWKKPLKHPEIVDCLLARKKAVQIKGIVKMEKPETALSVVMMDVESEIFRGVLNSLYRKRLPAVHIHDAIVLPEAKTAIDVKYIEGVMRKVYKRFGLHPTFSVDRYS